MIKTRLAVLLLLLAVPLRAQEAPRFFVERIDVRNLVHASPEVVRTESRLHEGTAYTETELRDANRRVKRLPFVLDAAFKLEKGSARNAYVLVIDVNETSPVFLVWDTIVYKNARFVSSESDNGAIGGARLFLGSSGVIHVAGLVHIPDKPYDTGYLSSQVGYTHYGIFGSQSFATVTANVNGRGAGGARSTVSPGALVGVALSPNQTLTVSYSAVDLDDRFNRTSQRILEAHLSYDTTNHPFFPTEGTLGSAGPVVARSEESGKTFSTHVSYAGVNGHAARYWPFGERNSVALVADGSFVHQDRTGSGATESYLRYGWIMAKLSRQLGAINRDREQRVELEVRTVSDPRLVGAPPGNSKRISIAWVRRGAIGLVRLGVGYAR